MANLLKAKLLKLGGEFMATANKNQDKVPYRIQLKHKALNRALGGGFIGGKVHEISSASGTGKSFLLYEAGATVINEMNGYFFLNDNEQAFEVKYGRKVGLITDDENRFFLTRINSLEDIFVSMRLYVKHIREELKDKKSPILLGIDSYKMMAIKIDLENEEALKDPKGYISMQKNIKFAERLEKFTEFCERHKATLIIINRLTKEYNTEAYGHGPKVIIKSLCEDGIAYNCTQRIRGTLGKQDGSSKKVIEKVSSLGGKDNEIKKQVGIFVTFETIKNRDVAPFQKSEVRLMFNHGTMPYSGLAEQLINEGLLTYSSKSLKKKGEDKSIKYYGLTNTKNEKFYPISATKTGFTDIKIEKVMEKIIDKYPELLKPIDTFGESIDTKEYTVCDDDQIDIDYADIEIEGDEDQPKEIVKEDKASKRLKGKNTKK